MVLISVRSFGRAAIRDTKECKNRIELIDDDAVGVGVGVGIGVVCRLLDWNVDDPPHDVVDWLLSLSLSLFLPFFKLSV